MSFDQDPNEQANISGADLAIMVDGLKSVTGQRDSAWKELRQIRESICANADESTLDEVRRVVAQRDGLLAALEGLHKVCSIALAGKDGKQHTYFETRAGHFVEATKAMESAESAIASVKVDAPEIVFYPAGSLGEEIEEEGRPA